MTRTGLALIAVTASVFALQVHQRCFIGDDAFISFRYARHLVNGQGLVWNPGEYVEGYTNFLWVLMMAGAIRLGLDPESASNALGIASGAGVLILLPLLAMRVSQRPSLLVLLPSLLLAASGTFTSWVTGGLETMWFTLLVTAALFAVIEERRREVARPLGSAALLGLAALTRPEGLLFAGVVGAWLAFGAVRNPREWKPLLSWGAAVCLIVGTHFVWRHAYYGAWLPNTFAAKVPAAAWDQGLKYTWHFTRAYGVPLFVPLIGLALWRKPDRDRLLVASCVTGYALYVVAIGGDRFEFRFWVPVLPLTYWLITDALDRLGLSRRLTAIIVAALLAATLHGSLESERAESPRWHGIASVSGIKAYAARRIEEGRLLQALIETGTLDRNLVLAVTGAGAVPYYTDWPTVDRHGLNDRYIASLPLATRGVIGHERDAPEEYLERRKVVIDDTLNQLIFRRADRMAAAISKSGGARPIYVVDVGDAYLVFSSFVPDAEVRREFSRLPIQTVLPGVDGP